MHKTKLGKVSLSPKGAWDASAAYEQLDMVSYDGGSWLAKKPSTNITPADGDYWMKVTERGDKGDSGAQGPQGEKGKAAWTYVELTVDDDLNEKTAQDTVYWSYATSICATLKNVPAAFISGECRLEVYWCGGKDYLIQRLFCKSGTKWAVYERACVDATFSDWVQQGKKGDNSQTKL